MTTGRKIPIPLRVVTENGQEKAAEPTDPYIATAVALPTPGYDGVGVMARTFIEEFARMGWSREKIARMFRIPRYEAANAVYRARGPEYVQALIEEILGTDRGGD